MSKLGFCGIEFHRKVVESGASLARSLASRFPRRTSTAQTFSGANEILVAFVPPSPTTPHRYQKRRSCARAKVEFKRFKRPSSPTFKIQRLSIAAAHLDARLIALHGESWRPLTQSLHPSSLPLLLLPRLHPNLLQGARAVIPPAGRGKCLRNPMPRGEHRLHRRDGPREFSSEGSRPIVVPDLRLSEATTEARLGGLAGAPAARGARSRRFLLRRCPLAAAARSIACNGGLRARVSTARRAAWTARLRSLSCCGRAACCLWCRYLGRYQAGAFDEERTAREGKKKKATKLKQVALRAENLVVRAVLQEVRKARDDQAAGVREEHSCGAECRHK